MAYNHTNKQYNLEEFRRYRDGEMSYQEQHNLERSLLEDAFFAEAYKGFIAMSTNQVPYDQSISSLSENLQNRIKTEKRKTAMLWMYASAASIIVGLGIVWLINSNNQQISEGHEIVKKTVSALPQQDKLEKEIKSGAGSTKIEPKNNPNKTHSEQDKDVPEPSLASAEKEQTDTIQIPGFQEESLAAAVRANTRTEIDVSPSPSSGYAPSGLVQKSVNQFITGQVTDENGDAVAGAIIQQSGNKGTQTDSNGNFRVNSQIGDSLTLAMIGYKTRSIRIAANNIGTLKLETDNQALNEVVIVGYGSQKKRSVSKNMRVRAYGGPAPAAGWESYQIYLDKMSDSSAVEGVVKVSFLVNLNGSLADFKTSGTTELFEKAIKIITSGPAWKPLKGNQLEAGKRAEVTIKFKAE